VIFLCPAGWSQEGAASPSADTSPETVARQPRGDVITLKSGKQLVGFKVIRQDARELVIRIMDGVEMTLPMRQVATVELDTTKPIPQGGKEGPVAPEQELIPGVKLAPALYEKLVGPVSEHPITIADEDALAAIVRLSKEAEVPLELGPGLEPAAAEQRRWTARIEPGTTFFAVLNYQFLREFPDLAVVYHHDRLILTTDAEAKKAREAAGDARDQETKPTDRANETPAAP